MDKKVAEDIISSALNIASDGRVESIKYIAPDKMMTSEQIQQLNLTKEGILEALLQDPRVISAEGKEGKFHIETEEGNITFNFVFGDEAEGVRFAIEDETTSQEPLIVTEPSIEKMVEALFDLCNKGVTVEDLIESFLKDPCVTTAEYRDGRFHIRSSKGTLNFWFPFLKTRSLEGKNVK